MNRFRVVTCAVLALSCIPGPQGKEGPPGETGPAGPNTVNSSTTFEARAIPSSALQDTFVKTDSSNNVTQDLNLGTHRATISYTTDGGVTTVTSTKGIYCGVTAPTTGNFPTVVIPGVGPTTGYRASKALCESACNSPLAHMCSREEIVTSWELGDMPNPPSPGYLWVKGGDFAYYSSSNNPLYDCAGWTSAVSTSGGACVHSTSNVPNWNWCNLAQPIACCK